MLAAVLAFAACSPSGARVTVRNDSGQSLHLFYCDNDSCTHGVNGNDVILKSGESDRDYWNSPDPTGPIGIASSPNDILIGCLSNPSQGQDDPPDKVLLTSQAQPCPGQKVGASVKIKIVNPG